MKFKPIHYTVINIFLIIVSFLFFIIIKPATKDIQLPLYLKPFVIFLIIWVSISTFRNKYHLIKFLKFKTYFKSILVTDSFILLFVLLTLYIFKVFYFSRLIVLGTIGLSLIIESFFGFIHFYFIHIPEKFEPIKFSGKKKIRVFENISLFKERLLSEKKTRTKNEEKKFQVLKNSIINEIGEDAFRFINKYINIVDNKNKIISTSTKFNIDNLSIEKCNCLINLKKVNKFRRINKFFESVNSILPDNGLYINYAETCDQRTKRIFKKYPPAINKVYFFIDFIFTRVFPRLKFIKSIYFFITKGKNRVISKAETLGRLYSCGFEIIEEKEINNLLYFVARKINKPVYDMQPSYGPIFKMKRIGQNGKYFFVYKFRTMHPYSEYLQNYILLLNGYSDIGKPANDFRLTKWGKFMRKYWIDEIPQLINVLKGDMKLVGIRPLSKRFLKEYPESFLKKRLKNKPGCVPPYVALLKQNIKDYIESEKIYLKEKEKHPYITDYKYFFKAFYNITTNKIHSS